MCPPKGTARPHLRSEQRLNYLVHTKVTKRVYEYLIEWKEKRICSHGITSRWTPASAIDKDSPNSEQSESISQKLQLQETDKYWESMT